MKTRYLYLIYFVMSVTDITVLNLSFVLLNYFLYPKSIGDLSTQLVSNYLWLLAALAFNLYTGKVRNRSEDIYRLTIKSFILYGLLFFSYVFFCAHHLSPGLLFYYYFIVFFGLILSRVAGSAFEKMLKKHYKIARPVAVIGLNALGLRLAGFFQNSDAQFDFEGFLDKEDDSFLDVAGNILPAVKEQMSSAAKKGIKDVYVSLSPKRIREFNCLQREADNHCLRLKLVPDISASFSEDLQLSYLGDFTVLSQRKEPLEEMENRFKKRLFDVIFSSLVIIFLLSWLYPLIAIFIKLQGSGPILFKQLRTGKDNKSFLCYKFRSMKVNNDPDRQATKDDDRITKIGAFLRKTSLDELPQFFNVFFGDMSIIGPRPHPLNMTKEYSQFINQYMVRHFLKSGITGWAQVNGYRGETKDPELMEQRVAHDVWYLEHWSMWLDIKIIFMTVIHIFKGEENAY